VLDRHVILSLSLLVLCSIPVTASAVSFDADGGGALPPQTITGFAYSPGNTLLQGIQPVLVGDTVQYLYQSTVASILDAGGNPVTPAGLGSTFEITTVASATMLVTAAGSTVSLILAPVQSPNSFVEYWFDTTPDANPLAGTGFNDGTRILVGFPTAALSGSSGYTVASSPPVQFDQFGANNYPGLLSVQATGTSSVGFTITSTDATFFPTPPDVLSLTATLAAPFTAVDPSLFFVGVGGGVPPGVLPIIGLVNGAAPPGGGPDVQLQASARGSFAPPTAVPEPSAWALLGAGLIALAAAVRKRSAVRRGDLAR
jgi:hypothetical protein